MKKYFLVYFCSLALLTGHCNNVINEHKEVINKHEETITTITEEHSVAVATIAEREEQLTDVLTKDLSNYKTNKFKVTAYSPFENVSGIEHDGDASVTSTGMKPGPTVIAVDPKVIPYYSDVIIVYDNGEVIKGIAGDCGGAIKGNKLDVFKYTYKETIEHGVRSATVIWRERK